jgi:ABC-2 type transport system permease protein
MRLYFSYFAMHVKSQLQHKGNFLMLLAGQFLIAFSALVSVWFMFMRFHQVDGFTFEEVLLCFASVLMAFTLAETFGRGFDRFPVMISNGEFDRALVRPRSLVFQVLVSQLDLTRLGRLVQAVLVFAWAIPKSGVVWQMDKVFTLVLMVACGAALFFALFVVYAALSFFTLEGLEFMNILTDGGREFGAYPFSIYGENVLRFLTCVVPLALVQYYPLLYLTGRSDSLLHMLSPLISLLFLLPARALWLLGLRHYKSTGS